MAVVYRGFDHNLQRPVAIKVLSEAAAAQPGTSERFRREARFVASLQHPHIVHIYDFGEDNGLTYMVQELLPGPTLEQQLHTWATQGTQPSREEVVRIARQVADALDAAHAAGILHRDIKPSNIIQNANAALVLTDFGIAKHFLDNASHTQTGTVIGTPNYLSPEQAQGQPLTPATDIYSFGVVIYELLAGQPPFTNPTPMGVLLDHIQTPPPPLRQFRPDLPPGVDAAVQRALAKKPEDRFGSAGAFAQALERAWVSGAAAAAPAPVPGLHSQPTVAWTSARRPAPPAPVAPQSRYETRPTAVPAAPPPAQPRSRSLLWPLFLLLLLLLGIGGVMAVLAGGFPGAATTTSPTTAPAAVIEPTGVPPTTVLTETPPPATPLPEDSIAQLRGQLEAGIADGRAGPIGNALLNTLDLVEQGVNANNIRGNAAATVGLASMRQQVTQAVEAGETDAGFGQDVLNGVDAIAQEYGLRLPQAEQSSEPPVVTTSNSTNGDSTSGNNQSDKKNNNPDKGKGKDKDKK